MIILKLKIKLSGLTQSINIVVCLLKKNFVILTRVSRMGENKIKIDEGSLVCISV